MSTMSYVCPDCLAEIGANDEQCLGCGFVHPADGWLKDPLTGLILSGRYRLESRLGEGGMATVYQASRLGSLGGNVAVKLLAPRFARTVVGKRFEREAQVISQLTNPYVVRIYDYDSVTLPGTDQPLYYIAMELVVGRTLEAVLAQQGKVNFLWGVDVLRQTARGLDEAHQAGITHRDLKPANLMLVEHRSSTHVKILDFGIAALTEGHASADEKLTQAGFVSGTPDYMAPEQAIGSADLGPRADIYALGIMAFEMFSGKRPFIGETVMDTLMQRVTQPAPRMAEACNFPGFPAELARIVDKMLQREPSARFPDAASLLDVLQRFPSFQTSPDFASPQQLQHAVSQGIHSQATMNAGIDPTTALTLDGDIGLGHVTARRRKAKGLWLAAAGLLATGGIAAAVLLGTSNDPARTAEATSATTDTPAVADANKGLARAETPTPDVEISGERDATTQIDAQAVAGSEADSAIEVVAIAPVELGYIRPALGPGWLATTQVDGKHLWSISTTEAIGPLFERRQLRIALDRRGIALRIIRGQATVATLGGETFATVKGLGEPSDGRLAVLLPPFPAAGSYVVTTTVKLPDTSEVVRRFTYDAGTGRLKTP